MRYPSDQPYTEAGLSASLLGGRFAFASDTILLILLSETVGKACTALAKRSRSSDSATASVFDD